MAFQDVKSGAGDEVCICFQGNFICSFSFICDCAIVRDGFGVGLG